jgi:hypothetical protein
VTQIHSRITGKEPPRLTPAQEEKCRQMFKDIQEPYEKFRLQKRKNFFSYPYCLYKFMQILNLNDYLKFFPMLKDQKKLKLMDDVWKKICEELGWEFIPSI